MNTFDVMDALKGHWKVRREKGLLPPFGLRKIIADRHGWTMVGMLPLMPFKVDGTSLLYKVLPLRDELSRLDDGTWRGRAYAFGKKYCEFRLEPA